MPPVRRWPFPYFCVAWLVAMSGVFLLLNGVAGVLDLGLQMRVGFVPEQIYANPLVALRTPIAMLLNNDAVQYSYVVAIFALAVPAFEARHGWRRTAFVFVAGGLGSVFLVTLAGFLPLSLLFPGNPVLVHSIARPYVGASTAVYAVAGALAATMPARRRWGILAGALAWETYVFWSFYHFSELNSVFHYVALGLGFGLARTRLLARLPALDEIAARRERADAAPDAEPQ